MLGNYCILLLWKEFNSMKRTDEVVSRESHMEIALETVLDKVAGVGRKSWISIMFRCTWTLAKWLWCHGMMSKLARIVRSIDASTHSSVDYVAMLVLRPHTPDFESGGRRSVFRFLITSRCYHFLIDRLTSWCQKVYDASNAKEKEQLQYLKEMNMPASKFLITSSRRTSTNA